MFEFCLPTGAKVVPDGPDWHLDVQLAKLKEAGADIIRSEKNGVPGALFGF